MVAAAVAWEPNRWSAERGFTQPPSQSLGTELRASFCWPAGLHCWLTVLAYTRVMNVCQLSALVFCGSTPRITKLLTAKDGGPLPRQDRSVTFLPSKA